MWLQGTSLKKFFAPHFALTYSPTIFFTPSLSFRLQYAPYLPANSSSNGDYDSSPVSAEVSTSVENPFNHSFFFYSSDTNGFLDAVRARVEAGGGELGIEKAKHLLKKYEALPRPKTPAEKRIETLERLMKDSS